DDSGFSDLDLTTAWFTGDPPSGTRLSAPMGLTLWLERSTHTVHLPVIDDHVEMRGWQLRQVAPTVAACFERLTLHASAVGIDGRIVAFVGESGVGKSTLAWALVKAGADPVSDDLLPIRFDAATAHVPTPFGASPIAAVCFLSRRKDILTIGPVGAAGALRSHVHNGFGEHSEPDVWKFQFDAYHRLVEGSPHVDLVIPDDRARVPAVADHIIDVTRNGELAS
ncbi:MAG TPA: hypothetical protein VLB67_02610, partial [Acidimicrobiia bacterium]|nr:hypothetical protein [Acidimicrobiia bacterium]